MLGEADAKGIGTDMRVIDAEAKVTEAKSRVRVVEEALVRPRTKLRL